jgi:hypothetical protein
MYGLVEIRSISGEATYIFHHENNLIWAPRMGGDYGGTGGFPPTFRVGDIVSYIPPNILGKKCFGAQDLGCLGRRIGERE